MSVGEAVAAGQGGPAGNRPHALDHAGARVYEWCGAQVVDARGFYDMSSIGPLADALVAAAAERTKVVLDASGITFADSALLNLLILTHQRTDLRVAAPPQQLIRLLQLTGVDTVLKVRETVEEAAAL